MLKIPLEKKIKIKLIYLFFCSSLIKFIVITNRKTRNIAIQ